MIITKQIQAEVTATMTFEDHYTVTNDIWTFMVPVYSQDGSEDRAIDEAFNMACALAQATGTYDEGLKSFKTPRPANIVYFIEWEGKLLAVRFIYSEEQKRYAMIIGDIVTEDGKTIKTINSR